MKKICFALLFFSLLGVSYSWAQTQEKSLYTLGSAGAGIVYNTYQFLDLLHNGLADQCHSPEFVEETSAAQIGLLEVIQSSFQDLLVSGEITDPSDKMYVQRIVEIVSLLKNQAVQLNNQAVNLDEASKLAYEETRQEAWVRISDLLQLDSN